MVVNKLASWTPAQNFRPLPKLYASEEDHDWTDTYIKFYHVKKTYYFVMPLFHLCIFMVYGTSYLN